jgi:hypothetical protein
MRPTQTIDIEQGLNHENQVLEPVKKIGLINAATGQKNYLAITPGTTAADILRKLQLPRDVVLTRGKGAEPFFGTENLYETLPDGSVLYVATPVEAGKDD